jgi:predicted Rossmann fold nucleotide-binding protein DprA/Smf involved in DNA uptake
MWVRENRQALNATPMVAIVGTREMTAFGGGVDTVFPAASRPLAQALLNDGRALVSEQLPGTSPSGPTLVAHNRLQSGLAQAVIIAIQPCTPPVSRCCKTSPCSASVRYPHFVGLNPLVVAGALGRVG